MENKLKVLQKLVWELLWMHLQKNVAGYQLLLVEYERMK
jgi:hypothetical protein